MTYTENQIINENDVNNELDYADNINDENNDINKVEDNNEEEIIDNNTEKRNIDLGLNDKIGYNLWDTIIKGV